ncbi:hypothetical protein KXD40_006322 [Peronospora effusa]|nr:hypothetical protein KXD40_006317 [Peronospora effusa]UIZ25685.1 hypothetical protein KXD40_006316 [Peronospora effusa]UIZ25686.1 hypothetical protein KXD40_006315 [Peronospora effusa]UIZ25688.1 hypothetical protein KXD40_006319 [Peronospora effusa]UIZ25689.1 hypothetical protein KXD40_006318 [Peronospora effusa]
MVKAARTHRTNALGVAARLSIYLSMRFVCLGCVARDMFEICSSKSCKCCVNYVRINESAVQRCGYNNHKASEATSIACTALGSVSLSMRDVRCVLPMVSETVIMPHKL